MVLFLASAEHAIWAHVPLLPLTAFQSGKMSACRVLVYRIFGSISGHVRISRTLKKAPRIHLLMLLS